MNILFVESDPIPQQHEGQTMPHPEHQYKDQRPMIFVVCFLMLLLPYISLLEPDMAHSMVLLLRVTGIVYMVLLALYLNPEAVSGYYWVLYLLGSSIGSSLMLTQHSQRTQPRLFEPVLLVTFGISALSMRPLITLKQWLNQPQAQDDQQLEPEEEINPPQQPPNEQPLNEPPPRPETPPRAKRPRPNIRGGTTRKPAKPLKHENLLRYFANRVIR